MTRRACESFIAFLPLSTRTYLKIAALIAMEGMYAGFAGAKSR
jgi:hypothetical protein